MQNNFVKFVSKSPMFSGISIGTLNIMFAYLQPKLLHCLADSYIVEKMKK
ncbi:Hcp transcriptional regulator HcpR (Crp/Fnr family) [Sporomusa ovata]|uniref:Hcp transcriptional regulator HcpR (Crp/Fnr family) n=1 Tax=Sporomusa ovata TaxID=2378 RepID=A0A0U1L2N2_9FIRM|nr:Hcp transcriptional regulator HcpR (Crp/Fnr family) [Sporomusa ovata]